MNPTVQAIVDDLERIVDQAKWAHTHGHWKAGHGLAAEHGTDLSRSEADRLKGPRYDIEVGDHNARAAYQKACIAVSRADLLFAAILHGPQPPLADLTIYSPPAQLEQAARTATWRAYRLTDTTGWTAKLSHLRKQTDAAVKDLSKAMDAGKADGIAHNEKMCRTCQIRPAADRKAECDTCATWRRRNGTTRPAALDQDAVNSARAAQARRLARGDGWGAALLLPLVLEVLRCVH